MRVQRQAKVAKPMAPRAKVSLFGKVIMRLSLPDYPIVARRGLEVVRQRPFLAVEVDAQGRGVLGAQEEAVLGQPFVREARGRAALEMEGAVGLELHPRVAARDD